MPSDHSVIHLAAGGIGGTAGAVVTCPLEVLKTRLQSSVSPHQSLSQLSSQKGRHNIQPTRGFHTHSINLYGLRSLLCGIRSLPSDVRSLLRDQGSLMRGLWHTEGFRGLFRGLGPNLIGVIPSRAIYFYFYANSKSVLNKCSFLTPDTYPVHMGAAFSAGFFACTCTNPIWFIKTRVQLDHGNKNWWSISRDVWRESGIRGFYRGLTASYVGISETMIHFVIYEYVKAKLLASDKRDYDNRLPGENDRKFSYVLIACAGVISKSCATTITYPHEVVRTRLREQGNKYKTFLQTGCRVRAEEGWQALYRGLPTQMIRQIPNTAIMMATYELVVYLHGQYWVTQQDRL